RWLISYPASLPAKKEEWRVVNTWTTADWHMIVKRLLELEMITEVDQQRPLLVKLTTEGRKAWEDFTDRHAREVNDPDFPSYLRGPWSKLRGYCGRLALIIHEMRLAAGEDLDNDVDGESMQRAAQLIDYFKSHARKVYVLMDADPKIA